MLYTFLFGRVDQSNSYFFHFVLYVFGFDYLFDKQIGFIKMLVSTLLYPVFELFVSIWSKGGFLLLFQANHSKYHVLDVHYTR